MRVCVTYTTNQLPTNYINTKNTVCEWRHNVAVSVTLQRKSRSKKSRSQMMYRSVNHHSRLISWSAVEAAADFELLPADTFSWLTENSLYLHTYWLKVTCIVQSLVRQPKTNIHYSTKKPKSHREDSSEKPPSSSRTLQKSTPLTKGTEDSSSSSKSTLNLNFFFFIMISALMFSRYRYESFWQQFSCAAPKIFTEPSLLHCDRNGWCCVASQPLAQLASDRLTSHTSSTSLLATV